MRQYTHDNMIIDVVTYISMQGLKLIYVSACCTADSKSGISKLTIQRQAKCNSSRQKEANISNYMMLSIYISDVQML